MPHEDTPLNAREAAEFLGAHVESIRRLARKAEIPAYKIGKDWRFRKDALRRWAETHHLRAAKRTILVVDDDAAVRSVLRRVLEHHGYAVTTAASGAEALDIARRQPPDAVILDLLMPGMDGPTTLERLRGQTDGVPVIVLTGYPDSDLMARALRFSPVTVLARPAQPDRIVEAVGSVLGGQPRG